VKVSLSWLRELVPLADRDAASVAAVLTQQGLEVEGVESRGRELAGVLVAEVVAIRPHPGAGKLRLVRVRAGGREEEVVCGAANVPPPGNRVCWAAPGARLPGGHTIEPREIRGVLSPGMLCSESEMGLGPAREGDGILILSPSAPTGIEVAAHLGVVDDVLEVNVTPNRPDALSHLGIAREVAAGLRLSVRVPAVDEVPELPGGPPLDVQLADPEACPRYLARFITGLTVGPSPLAMRLRLEACGMRSISNLVDVTNYILLETGHPLHAFDRAKLSAGIQVRRASAGERLITLDGQERVLVAQDIVIADGSGGVALAGVMGGAATELSDGTRDVVLEAATFDPPSIRRTARRLGLHSEASYRFERGVDADGLPYAAARAAALMARLGGGAVLSAAVDRYPRPAAPRRVVLTMKRLERISGIAPDTADAADRLGRLGFGTEVGDGAIAATVPTFRPDVTIEEDLIEEVMRMGEYGAQPTKRLASNARSAPNPERPADRARDLLAAAGLHEIVTWGFVARTALHMVAARDDGSLDPDLADAVLVKNPLSSDYEAMRTTLLPGLAEAVRRNLARGVTDPRLFEVGPVVRRSVDRAQPPREPVMAAGLLAGRASGWLRPGEPLDFFDLKRVVEELLRGFGIGDESYAPPAGSPLPFLHPGVSAEIRLPDGTAIGALGELHPRLARRLELEARAFYFEVALERLGRGRPALRTAALPRYPAATRDVSFWIDARVPAAEQRAALLAAGEPLLRNVAILEDFRDPRYVPAGKKGMLWTMTYQADDRTLTDQEADGAHARVVGALTSHLTIQIR
jgi:phenylalanyl-tRNA synthetase beta chain